MTEGFYGSNDRLILSEDYETVYHFYLEYKRISINGYVRPKTFDLSDTLTDLLKQYNGDAIVNLKVSAIQGRRAAGWDLLSLIFCIPTLSFFSPSKVEAFVEGDVVKMKRNLSSSVPSKTLLVFGNNWMNPYIKKVF